MSINLVKDSSFKDIKVPSQPEGPQIAAVKLDQDDFDNFNKIMDGEDEEDNNSNSNSNSNNNSNSNGIGGRRRSRSRSIERTPYQESELDFDDFDDKSSQNSRLQRAYRPEMANLSQKETRARKAHMLWKLNKLNQNNRYSPIEYSMEDSLDVLENEYIRIEKQIENETGTQMIKDGYIGMASFVEFFSARQKIVALNLTNWSYKVALECQKPNYEKVFSQIYDKYLSTVEESDPLLTLVYLTVMSATSYHFTHQTVQQPKKEPEIEEESDEELEDIMNKLNQNGNGNNGNNGNVSRSPSPQRPLIVRRQQPKEEDSQSVISNLTEELEKIELPTIPPKKRRGRPKKVQN